MIQPVTSQFLLKLPLLPENRSRLIRHATHCRLAVISLQRLKINIICNDSYRGRQAYMLSEARWKGLQVDKYTHYNMSFQATARILGD